MAAASDPEIILPYGSPLGSSRSDRRPVGLSAPSSGTVITSTASDDGSVHHLASSHLQRLDVTGFMSSPASDRSTPAGVRAAWIAAVAANDPDALRPLLTEDYEVWAHATPPLRGIDAAVGAMRAALERYHIEQSFEPVETVIAGDWAFERGMERMTITPIAGGSPQTLTQRALLILRRGSDGNWRYARGFTNGLPNGKPHDAP